MSGDVFKSDPTLKSTFFAIKFLHDLIGTLYLGNSNLSAYESHA